VAEAASGIDSLAGRSVAGHTNWGVDLVKA
jgi:hypothetical protein